MPGSGRFPGGGQGNPFQYSCLENPMDRGPWQAIVHEVISIGHDLATFKFSPLGMQVNGHSSWCHFTNNYTLISCRACSQCPRHCAVSLRATGKMSLGIFFKATTLYHKSNFHLTKTTKEKRNTCIDYLFYKIATWK